MIQYYLVDQLNLSSGPAKIMAESRRYNNLI